MEHVLGVEGAGTVEGAAAGARASAEGTGTRLKNLSRFRAKILKKTVYFNQVKKTDYWSKAWAKERHEYWARHHH